MLEQANRGRMPVVFAGHGSPMNAIEDNEWSRGFASLAALVPEPRAILAVSAHWFVPGLYLTANAAPKTIHDFGGFPRELFEVQYPAPGHVDLAVRVRQLIGGDRAALDSRWGLDHGTWSVLKWMYPEADIPVIQLSIDRRLPVHAHYELSRSLASLREEQVLILGSGNVTHNLRDAFGRLHAGNHETPGWARRYDRATRTILEQRDTEALLSLSESSDGQQAHPTLDHWLPMIYAYGATDDKDTAQFPTEGFDWGSLSMRNVVLG